MGPVMAQSGSYERPPDINLDRLLPPSMLQSSSHQVRAEAPVSANSVRFAIGSQFGLYQVSSLPLFLTRIHEIRTLDQAISSFEQNNRDVAVQLRGDLEIQGDSAVDILFRPVSATGELAKQLGSQVGQTVDEIRRTAGAPNVDLAMPYHAAMPDDPVLASHKRSVANQLGLDVYSSNPRIQSFLNTVAVARSGGSFRASNLAVTVARLPVRQVAGGKVHAASRAAVTRDSIPELKARNSKRLAALGIDQSLAASFGNHPNLSPWHKTAIIEYLAFLDSVGNRGALLRAALKTQSEEQALGYVETGRMLGLYHESSRPIQSLLLASHLVMARTRNEVLAIVLPFDVLYWDRATAKVFDSLQKHARSSGYRGTELLLTGIATPKARASLKAAGVTVYEKFAIRSGG